MRYLKVLTLLGVSLAAFPYARAQSGPADAPPNGRNQGYAEQGYPDQGDGDQSYADPAYSDQGYENAGDSAEGYSDSAYAREDYLRPAPVCAYGYYEYPPYACAPSGYYNSNYFAGGIFIGAGPWFHGFRGGRGYIGHPAYGQGRPFVGSRGQSFVRRGPVGPHSEGVNRFHGGNRPRGGSSRGGGRR